MVLVTVATRPPLTDMVMVAGAVGPARSAEVAGAMLVTTAPEVAGVVRVVMASIPEPAAMGRSGYSLRSLGSEYSGNAKV